MIYLIKKNFTKLQFCKENKTIYYKKYLEKCINVISNHQKRNIIITMKYVSKKEILYLNTYYKNSKNFTNVLSFPSRYSHFDRLSKFFVGDLALCLDIIKVEAFQYNKSIINHLLHIFVHGVLHLLGYRHNNYTFRKTMQAAEIEILSILGYNNPYNKNNLKKTIR